MIFTSPKPQFITNIVVQAPEKFKKSVKGFKEVSPFPYYRVTDGVTSAENKVTYNANTCAILAMSNGKETYLGHYAPEVRKSDFMDKLDFIIKKFQDSTGRVSAIVVGGHDFRNINPIFKSKDSYKQLADIGNLLDKNNVNNLTMIAGKVNPVFKDNLAVSEDKFIITHTPDFSKNPMKLKGNPNQAELEKLFSDNYSIVEIDPEHSINYIG